ncbi:MAG: TonB-dependent receptor [Vicinamibacterales bacterium]
MRYVIRTAIGVLGLTGVLVSVAVAQTVGSTAGAINGTVTDSTKAVLPGVTVTVTSASLMGTTTVVTDQNGFFRAPALPPGDYVATFELAGFTTVKREGIRVSVGFTATVNTELTPSTVQETVTVSGAAPVGDLQATSVATRFDAEQLASLPGSRDFWALVAQAPAVSMSRMDVGGSGALTQQPYVAYGLTSGGGVNRAMVEGILVNEGGGGGGSDMYYTDYGSFAEVAVNSVGNTAEMPNPGVLSQFISKSGGNTYHGNLYLDYENDSMEAHNISDAQIARGVRGSNVLDVRDTNRLSTFTDFNVDLGGFLVKDKLWWYGAYRRTVTDQRYPTLLDDIQHTWVPVLTGKLTYNLNARHKVIGYFQHADKRQPDYLGAVIIPGGRTTTALMNADTVWNSQFPLNVWKAEYNAVLRSNLLLEVRTGGYHSLWQRDGKSAGPRIEDTGSNFVSGGTYGTDFNRDRPQFNGSLSYSKTGWIGSHNFKVGGELMRDTLEQPFRGFANASNAVSVLNNGAPLEVYVYRSPNASQNGLWTQALYANDTWQMSRRVTLNLGVRLDRHQPFYPTQTGPTGQTFQGVDKVLVWNNVGPRLGVSYDVTGDGRTVVKASFGQFYLNPAADFATNVNPNPPLWFNRYAWTDTNGNGVWNPGEEGRLIAVAGGTASTTLDPNIQNTFTRQGTVYVERELMPNFGVRTGVVWNGRREVRGQINVNRRLADYNVPVEIRDPGPDGRAGTSDDGATFTGYNLSAEALARPVVNITTNLDGADSDYYSWELTATRREARHWSMQASFAETWTRETRLGAGTSYTPNVLINTVDGRNRTRTWQGKINATLQLPWNLRLTPVLRHQAGTPYGRTFTATFNYGSATVLAFPASEARMPNITVFDIRSEKAVNIRTMRLVGFFDVYNIANTNAEQEIAVASGTTFLRPVAITAPRIARLGIKWLF